MRKVSRVLHYSIIGLLPLVGVSCVNPVNQVLVNNPHIAITPNQRESLVAIALTCHTTTIPSTTVELNFASQSGQWFLGHQQAKIRCDRDKTTFAVIKLPPNRTQTYHLTSIKFWPSNLPHTYLYLPNYRDATFTAPPYQLTYLGHLNILLGHRVATRTYEGGIRVVDHYVKDSTYFQHFYPNISPTQYHIHLLQPKFNPVNQ